MARLGPCISVLFFAITAGAHDQPERPIFASGGMPPSIGVVEEVRSGKLMFRQTHLVPFSASRRVPVTKTVVVDGKEQQQTEYRDETITKMKTVPVVTAYELADVRAFDTNSKPIPSDQLPRLFARPGMVLFANPNIHPVDPAYLKIAKDGTPFPALVPKAPPPAATPALRGVPVQPAPAPATTAPPQPKPGEHGATRRSGESEGR
jgi:hypothetical protein